jgi:predicted transcriptional regulator
MPYDEDSIKTSGRAYEVFRFISQREEGSYGTEIAEELDMNQSSVSNIIRYLYMLGLVEKGKRDKAQYYIFDSSNLNTVFSKIWAIKLDIHPESYELSEFLSQMSDEVEKRAVKSETLLTSWLYDLSEDLDDREQMVEDLSHFIDLYVANYLELFEHSTINDMFYGSFQSGLRKVSFDEDFGESLETFRIATEILEENFTKGITPLIAAKNLKKKKDD